MLRSPVVLAWVAFPVVVVLVSFGCGLLVERIGGWRLPGAIAPGVGLALVIVAADLLTRSTTLAPLTPWIVLGLALLGYATSLARMRAMRLNGWTLALGLLLFAVFAAPIVATGHATFAGYEVDGDPAFHFLLAQEVLAHGRRSLTALPFQYSPSVRLMAGYLADAYPLGADLGAAALRPFVGTALPWIYDPFIAVFLTFGGLALHEMLRDLVASRPLRALCAFIAAQAGLAYSFYLISSIKELAITWLTTLLVLLATSLLRRPPAVRALAPLVVVATASLYALAVPAVAWIGVPLLAFVIASLWRLRGRLRRPSLRLVGELSVAVAAVVALSLPVLLGAATSFTTTTHVLGGGSGNVYADLLGRLSLFQILGIWPVGDFRHPLLHDVLLVHVLLWIAIASAIGGALWVIAHRSWGPGVLLLGNGLAALVLLPQATPYAASKVEAILSITAIFAAMLGAVALWHRIPVAGWALAAVIALAVLWTNGRSLQSAPVAPQPRFAELARIDARFAGVAPTFYNLWDAEYPAFFLRRVGAYLPTIFDNPATRRGATYPTGNAIQIPWDPNDLSESYVQSMSLLVLGRSPTLSRPPANFRLAFRGRFYDVYRREAEPRVLAHLPVSTGPLGPAFSLSCPRIGRIAARARRERAQLAYAPQIAIAYVPAVHSVHPLSWRAYPPTNAPIPGGLALSRSGGTLTSKITVPEGGRYNVWLQGSLDQPLTVSIGLHTVGTVSGQVGPGGLWSDLGTTRLTHGVQPVIMRRRVASPFLPEGLGDELGSLVLTRGSAPPAIRTVSPARWRSLCATSLQWLEITRGR